MVIRRGDSHIYYVDFARLESALELMNTRCVDKYVNVISQLNVLVSHKPNLSICTPGTWGIILATVWGVQFF